jgi:hypothetical protein
MRKDTRVACVVADRRVDAAVWTCNSMCGADANRQHAHEKSARSWYYPEIASLSPQFVITTFSSSHTIMGVTKRSGLIVWPEARIVDPRPASNRLSKQTQSAARRRISRPQTQSTNDKRNGCETSAWPLVNVAGYDRWLDRQLRRPRPKGRRVDLTMESLASGVQDPAWLGGETRRGGAAQQNSAGEFALACCDVKRV